MVGKEEGGVTVTIPIVSVLPEPEPLLFTSMVTVALTGTVLVGVLNVEAVLLRSASVPPANVNAVDEPMALVLASCSVPAPSVVAPL